MRALCHRVRCASTVSGKSHVFSRPPADGRALCEDADVRGEQARRLVMSVAVLTGILFGLVPALRAARLDLNPILKGTSRGITGGGSRPSMMMAPGSGHAGGAMDSTRP